MRLDDEATRLQQLATKAETQAQRIVDGGLQTVARSAGFVGESFGDITLQRQRRPQAS